MPWAISPPLSCRNPYSGRTYPVEAEHLLANQHLDPRQVIGQIHQAHTHLGACRANGLEKDAAHTVRHVPKDMLDPGAHPRLGGVADFLLLGQRRVVVSAFVNLAFVLACLEVLLLFVRAVRTIRPDLLAAFVLRTQHGIEHLTVVDVGRCRGVRRDEFGVAVDVDVALVAVVALSTFLRPAGVDVLLRELGRCLAPVDGDGVLFDEGVVFAPVALDRHGNKGGVDDLSALEFDAQIGQRLIETLEQGVNQIVGLERFAERPDGAGVGHVAREFETEEAHEGEPVGDLVLQAFVGQVVQTLQDEQLEHEDAAGGLVPSSALALFSVNSLKDGTENFPVDDGIKPFKGIARCAQAGVAVLKVEQAGLHGRR